MFLLWNIQLGTDTCGCRFLENRCFPNVCLVYISAKLLKKRAASVLDSINTMFLEVCARQISVTIANKQTECSSISIDNY